MHLMARNVGPTNIRNTEEAVRGLQYSPRLLYNVLTKAHRAAVSMMAKGCIVA